MITSKKVKTKLLYKKQCYLCNKPFPLDYTVELNEIITDLLPFPIIYTCATHPKDVTEEIIRNRSNNQRTNNEEKNISSSI